MPSTQSLVGQSCLVDGYSSILPDGNVESLSHLISNPPSERTKVVGHRYNIEKTPLDEAPYMVKFTLLHQAARFGRVEACKFLLRIPGMKIGTAVGHNGETPLSLAAENGHVDTCMLLLNRDAKPNSRGNGHQGRLPALLTAARGGHLPVVRLLVEEYGMSVDSGGAEGFMLRPVSAVEMAVRGGHADVCRYLLEKGATPSHRGLHEAIKRGAVDCLGLFLSHMQQQNMPLMEAKTDRSFSSFRVIDASDQYISR